MGSLDLGLRLALPTARTVCYVERELAAVRVLEARMRDGWLCNAPVWDDVTTFDARPWRGAVDLVLAGFPCQPVSVAGKRRGRLDQRWLWDDVLRVFVESGARWLFLENVRGIITKWLPEVLGSLADVGCSAEWLCLRASDVGAPHRRDRWFCVAHRCRDGSQGRGATGTATASTGLGGRALGDADSGLAHARHELGTCGAFADGHGPTWPPGPSAPDAWRAVLERRPELAPAVEVEPAVRGVAHGLAPQVDISRARRLSLLGNGVVPVQAAVAFTELLSRMYA